MAYWVSQSGACLISLAFWVFRGIRMFGFTNSFTHFYYHMVDRKNVFSYLHSTVNGTFDIDFRSIIIIKLRCKNNISSPTGASQQERDKDHFSVSSSNKITLDNSLSVTILLYGLSLFGSVSSSMEHHPLFRDAGWETLAPLPLVDSSQRNYCQCSYRWPSQDGFIHHNANMIINQCQVLHVLLLKDLLLSQCSISTLPKNDSKY